MINSGNIFKNFGSICDFSALLRLLRDAVGRADSNSQYVELLVRCLWSVIPNLKEWVDTVNISTILVDLHEFLKVGSFDMNFIRAICFLVF